MTKLQAVERVIEALIKEGLVVMIDGKATPTPEGGKRSIQLIRLQLLDQCGEPAPTQKELDEMIWKAIAQVSAIQVLVDYYGKEAGLL